MCHNLPMSHAAHPRPTAGRLWAAACLLVLQLVAGPAARAQDPATLRGQLADGTQEQRQSAAWALAADSDPATVQALVGALDDPKMGVRKAALESLGSIGDPAAGPAVAAQLASPDALVRAAAAWTVARLGYRPGLDDLAALLHDTAADVREAAAWSIARLDPDAAARALPAVAGDENAEVREAVAWGLRGARDPAALRALATLAADPMGRVRAAAAWGLAESGDDALIATLESMLHDRGPRVRRAAARALAKSGRPLGDPAVSLFAGDAAGAAALVALAHPELKDVIAVALGDPDPAVRAAAARLAGRVGDPVHVAALESLGSSPTLDERVAAARALAEIRGQPAWRRHLAVGWAGLTSPIGLAAGIGAGLLAAVLVGAAWLHRRQPAPPPGR